VGSILKVPSENCHFEKGTQRFSESVSLSETTNSAPCIYKVPLCEILIPGDLREVDEPLVRGGVMPTWALMPLLQEPV